MQVSHNNTRYGPPGVAIGISKIEERDCYLQIARSSATITCMRSESVVMFPRQLAHARLLAEDKGDQGTGWEVWLPAAGETRASSSAYLVARTPPEFGEMTMIGECELTKELAADVMSFGRTGGGPPGRSFILILASLAVQKISCTVCGSTYPISRVLVSGELGYTVAVVVAESSGPFILAGYNEIGLEIARWPS